jgi:hypothetical protein
MIKTDIFDVVFEHHTMEQTYDNIVTSLLCILEPRPLNQLGMPNYCRSILAVLSQIKEQIRSIETYYKDELTYWEMGEEF